MGSGMSCADCCSCCCPDDSNGEKYPQVKYQTPSEFKASTDSRAEKPPLTKVYEFSQPHTDFTLHPQLTTSSSDTDSTDVISEQPHFRPHSHHHHHRKPTVKDSARPDLLAMDTQPTLMYALYHDMQRSTLTVSLRQAFNLPMRRKNKPMDSYVCLHLQQEVQRSKVVKNSLNPMFEEKLEFTGQPSLQILKKQVLVFKVFSLNKYSSPDLVGVVRVKLEDANLFGEVVHKRIEESSADDSKVETIGDVLFSLTYLPQSDTIQGTLLKAANLKAQDITGTADPYVKVHVIHKDKKVHSWKSSVRKHTLTPVYNDPFQFNIHHMDTNHMRLDIIVMDYDRFSRDDLMGLVRVGPNVQDEIGRAHWDEMMSSPNQPISRWHPILPAAAGRHHGHSM